jgi:hypothetical protein
MVRHHFFIERHWRGFLLLLQDNHRLCGPATRVGAVDLGTAVSSRRPGRLNHRAVTLNLVDLGLERTGS